MAANNSTIQRVPQKIKKELNEIIEEKIDNQNNKIKEL